MEYFYIVFLFLILILSVSIEITWAEIGFRICSVVMGIFGIFFLVMSVIYGSVGGVSQLLIFLIASFTVAYIIPLCLNYRKLKFLDTIKGLIYSTYMVPTFVNILSIYAISNIQDISWTSNPNLNKVTKTELEKEREFAYKNYRSKFLI